MEFWTPWPTTVGRPVYPPHPLTGGVGRGGPRGPKGPGAAPLKPGPRCVHSSYDVIVFSDSDAQVPPNFLRITVTCLEVPEVGLAFGAPARVGAQDWPAALMASSANPFVLRVKEEGLWPYLWVVLVHEAVRLALVLYAAFTDEVVWRRMRVASDGTVELVGRELR